MGLLDYISGYRPYTGNKFLTCAVPAIHNALVNYIRSYNLTFEALTETAKRFHLSEDRAKSTVVLEVRHLGVILYKVDNTIYIYTFQSERVTTS